MRSCQMEKVILSTELAPRAIGPYSQAVRVGQFVFLSGQLGVDVKSGLLKDGIEAQTHQVLDNIGAVLSSLGLNYSHVVKTLVFVRDLEDFDRINAIYATVFSDAPPARSLVEVSRLPKRALIEIECIAVYPE